MTTDINLAFCQQLLRTTLPKVREAFPGIKTREASVIKMSGGGTRPWWLFEYIHEGKNFSYETQADNSYEAKCNGWQAFMKAMKQESEKR